MPLARASRMSSRAWSILLCPGVRSIAGRRPRRRRPSWRWRSRQCSARALVGCRLFVPEEWSADKPRCLKAGMPEEQIKPRGKIEHISDLIDQAVEQGLRFKLVGCDSFYGRDQGLLGRIADKGLIFVADIPRDTQVWTKKPQGEQRPRAVGASGATRVDQLKTLPMSRVKVRDAENGPVVVRAWQTIRCANGAAGTTTWRWWGWRCSSCWR
ncbi:MAG TPA: hypothetical protein DDZ88_13590, partial [Verrucomicrobiales bacterium]|nr:hypothetical protein [Verrucomicrobiales bacterium]